MKIQKKIRAFTLVEMMVTIAVLAIIIGIATPSFVEMMRQNTVRSQANELLGLMHYARTEAIKRREIVNVEVELGSVSGWIAKVNVVSTDENLRELNKTSTSVTLDNAATVGFNSRGRLETSVSPLEINYYDYCRKLTISIGGSMKIEECS
jgi:type IV fimbrial biogenesis protein FimT